MDATRSRPVPALAKARQTFRNLDAVFRAGGSCPELVVNTTVLVADANDFAALNRVRRARREQTVALRGRLGRMIGWNSACICR